MPKKTSVLLPPWKMRLIKSYVTPAGAFAVSDEFDSKYTFVPLDFFSSSPIITKSLAN
ncbi:MAG: hypothetical protein IPP60_07620 [Sphingobacteriales bacterium]|nr:hypothetical protein [Sphingobacteriales bacterium]